MSRTEMDVIGDPKTVMVVSHGQLAFAAKCHCLFLGWVSLVAGLVWFSTKGVARMPPVFGIWHGSLCLQTGCHACVLRGWGQQQVHQHMLQ